MSQTRKQIFHKRERFHVELKQSFDQHLNFFGPISTLRKSNGRSKEKNFISLMMKKISLLADFVLSHQLEH